MKDEKKLHLSCPTCGQPINHVVSIPKVIEPGNVIVFDCPGCQKLEFRDAPLDPGD